MCKKSKKVLHYAEVGKEVKANMVSSRLTWGRSNKQKKSNAFFYPFMDGLKKRPVYFLDYQFSAISSPSTNKCTYRNFKECGIENVLGMCQSSSLSS